MSRDMTGACEDWNKAKSLGIKDLDDIDSYCEELK